MVSKGFSTGLLGMMGCGKAKLNTKVDGLTENFPMQRIYQADIELPTRNEIFVTIPVQAMPLAQQHDVVQVREIMLVICLTKTDQILGACRPVAEA
jgi:hypothetical protein